MGLTVLGALTAPVVTLAALGTLDGLSRVAFPRLSCTLRALRD